MSLEDPLDSYFRDADSDRTYRADSDNTGTATVSVNESDRTLTVTGVADGTATVTATDECDESVSQSFTVTVVENQAPRVWREIPDQTMKNGKSLTWTMT